MRKAITIILITLLFLVSCASAATLNVPAKYKTIQGAINAAQDGDNIKVACGIYKENIRVEGKQGLIITGVGFPTINGALFTYGAGGGTLFGFKVIKSGVQSEAGGLTVRNNQIVNCDIVIGGQSGGENTVLNNKITNGGIGIYDLCFDNSIIGNYVYGAKIGLIIKDSSVRTVTKNTFKNCQLAVQANDLSNFIGNTYIGNKKKFP